MTAAVTITPASGSITHAQTVCEIGATGLTANDSTAYDATKYPTEPAITMYFKAAATGQQTLKSRVLASNAAGLAEWHDVIFPAAATWTLTICKVSDDSVVATASVVVA